MSISFQQKEQYEKANKYSDLSAKGLIISTSIWSIVSSLMLYSKLSDKSSGMIKGILAMGIMQIFLLLALFVGIRQVYFRGFNFYVGVMFLNIIMLFALNATMIRAESLLLNENDMNKIKQSKNQTIVRLVLVCLGTISLFVALGSEYQVNRYKKDTENDYYSMIHNIHNAPTVPAPLDASQLYSVD